MEKRENTIAQDKKNESDSGIHELKSSLDFAQNKSDKIAVLVINVLGSMRFLVGCSIFFAVWISWNLNFTPFDPFPFPILEMVVTIFAIILSVSVLINQNRQGRIDKIRNQVEFEVNVRAESEVTKVLNMLHEVHQKLGLNTQNDKELEEMKEQTDIKQIHQTLDDREEEERSLLDD